ncbi:MAG TPA: type I-C CRISPR-associated protein Cas8c/Csd1, partial [Anaerovoracaceae bacterium]|nr:type I-C CRISPR-associated protein Cas8c/Csd1 [Anaerovoracaceae bacterium]
MILGALVDYYEILAEAGEISRPGYCKAKVSYALNLTQSGALAGVLPLKVETEKGKKKIEVPQLLEVPEQEKRSVDIKANFLCDNSGYILGIDNKGKPERSKLCFGAFKRLHHKVLDTAPCVEAKAILTFLDTWNPDQLNDCTAIADYSEELISGSNIIFNVIGIGFVHESPSVKEAWEKYRNASTDSVQMQCLITGQVGPIARLHPSIKGVKGSQSMGASLVSFNARAYESYGRDE